MAELCDLVTKNIVYAIEIEIVGISGKGFTRYIQVPTLFISYTYSRFQSSVNKF